VSDSARPAIGFIGLGLMGSAMVERLQGLGYRLTVRGHHNRAPIEAAVARGAAEAPTPKALAAASDIVMLCVDTSASVEANVFGDEGVLAGLRKGAALVDFGTSLPGSTKRIGAAAAEIGAQMMDAPLGRTPAHAREGKLNIMAGGDKALYDRLKPVFDDLGENVFHVGPLGAGNTLKLINNFFAMTTAVAMSEAFAMADKAGLDRETLYAVMSAGPLKSGMMDFVKANAIDGIKDRLAFSIANARKDIGYYGLMADELDSPSLMSPATKQALGLAKAEGWGGRMVPEMVDFIAGLYGSKP
jgi:3-hydroxyisobutyrate dehydrogenase-like beta-hydroxyacid dehydrogenase